MSWFEKNYEKAALGGAAVIALGLAGLGWSKLGQIETDFTSPLTGGGNTNTAVKDADLIPKAQSSFQLNRTWDAAETDAKRKVDLFTGIPLFVSRNAPDKQQDLPNAAPVHDPIPNTWWLEHRLDLGFADSPQRDPDQDGFSNLEEYLGKTDPNDPKSVPSLIAKLTYLRDESLGWVIRPSYGEGDSFPFRYVDTAKGVNQTGAANPVAPGSLFFATGKMANRFKLLGSEVRKELTASTGVEREITYVRIEDQRFNKKGVVYEFPAPLSEERMNEHLKYDRTAIFSLEALGQGGKEFKVEENTTFALPSGGATKDYLLKTVSPTSVTVEYTDGAGERKTVEISKGSMPDMTK